jgi:hypothetical protein
MFFNKQYDLEIKVYIYSNDCFKPKNSQMFIFFYYLWANNTLLENILKKFIFIKSFKVYNFKIDAKILSTITNYCVYLEEIKFMPKYNRIINIKGLFFSDSEEKCLKIIKTIYIYRL